MNTGETPVAPSSNPGMPVVWTIRELISWSGNYLRQRGSESARLDAELLLARALNCPRLQLYLDIDKPLQPMEREAFKTLLKRRAAGEPMAYILGEREFFGRTFKVDKRVLIPRPETELLIEQVLRHATSAVAETELRILDIGTGTGCIATTLACELPKAQVVAWDISPDALDVASQNADQCGVQGRVTFAQVDILNDQWPTATYDLIVSNPPYVAEADRSSLKSTVVDFEPSHALFAGENGLEFYRVLAERASALLVDGGMIFLEIGSTQAPAVVELLTVAGWPGVRVCKDLSGHDRVVVATKVVTVQ